MSITDYSYFIYSTKNQEYYKGNKNVKHSQGFCELNTYRVVAFLFLS